MTDQELKDVIIEHSEEWPSLVGFAAARNIDVLTLVRNNGGFSPFETIDLNRDGLISYAEWSDAGHPACHAPFTTVVPESFFTDTAAKLGDEKKVYAYKYLIYELVWHLMADSTTETVNPVQYTTILTNLGNLVSIDENSRLATYKGNNAAKAAAVELFNTKVRALYS